jgi:hypothetical protein
MNFKVSHYIQSEDMVWLRDARQLNEKSTPSGYMFLPLATIVRYRFNPPFVFFDACIQATFTFNTPCARMKTLTQGEIE